MSRKNSGDKMRLNEDDVYNKDRKADLDLK